MRNYRATLFGLALFSAVVLLTVQHRQKSQLTTENDTLRSQVQQLERVTRENERLSNLVAQTSAQASAPATAPEIQKEQQELQRLRGEVSVLRKSLNEAAAAPKPSAESALSGLTQNPEMSKALRDQQKLAFSMIYKGFGQQAKIAPEKLEALGSLLADDVMTNVNHITAALRDAKGPEEVEQVFARQEVELQGKIKDLIGEEAYGQFKEYNRNLLGALTSEQFSAMINGDQAHKESVAKQLSQILKEETQNALSQAGLGPDYQAIPTLNFRNFASEQEAERNLQLLDAIFAQAEGRSAAFLKADELQKLSEFRKLALNSNRMALSLNRKLMAPGNR